MKKSLIAFVVTLVFSISTVSASAQMTTTVEQKSNEFLMVEEDVSELSRQLQNVKPLTTQYKEISDKLKEYGDYREKFIKQKNELKKLSTLELRNIGYNDTQIEAILSDSVTDEVLALSSATLSGSLTQSSYTYNLSTNTTKYKVRYYGSWNGIPLFKGTDNIAVAIAGNGDHFFYAYSSSSCSLNYHLNYAGTTYTKNVSGTEVFRNLTGIIYKAPVSIPNPVVLDVDTFLFLKNFTVYFEGQMEDDVKISEASALYGHMYMSFAPSIGISISASPSAGIDFGIQYGYQDLLPKVISSTRN